MSFPQSPPLGAEPLYDIPVTIAAGTAVSTVAFLNGNALVRLLMPAAWTAASITVSIGDSAGTLEDLYTATGTEYSLTVAANHAVDLNPQDFVGANYIRLRSGPGAAAVNQVAQAIITLQVRPIA